MQSSTVAAFGILIVLAQITARPTYLEGIDFQHCRNFFGIGDRRRRFQHHDGQIGSVERRIALPELAERSP